MEREWGAWERSSEDSSSLLQIITADHHCRSSLCSLLCPAPAHPCPALACCPALAQGVIHVSRRNPREAVVQVGSGADAVLARMVRLVGSTALNRAVDGDTVAGGRGGEGKGGGEDMHKAGRGGSRAHAYLRRALGCCGTCPPTPLYTRPTAVPVLLLPPPPPSLPCSAPATTG